MRYKHGIILIITSLFGLVASAQKVDLDKFKTTAIWGLGGNDRIIFESHSVYNIIKYDSLIPALRLFLEDAESSGIVLDSLPSPFKVHYVIFPNDERKLTVENPEFLAAGFNLQEEIKKNEDSLPNHVIFIYDRKYQITMSIYLEQVNNLIKLKKILTQWEKTAMIPESEIMGDIDSFNSIPTGSIEVDQTILNYNFRVFKKLLKTANTNVAKDHFLFKTHLRLYDFRYNSVESGSGTMSVVKVSHSIDDGRGVRDFYTSVGLLGNNVCTQFGNRFPLYVKFKENLPVNIFYANVGATLYSTGGNNSSVMGINGYYEGLLGFKTMNTTPTLTKVKDFRSKGFECGGFLSDRGQSGLFPRTGLVLKSYKQWGDIRFTSGVYMGYQAHATGPEIQSALLFTIELFDLF